MSCGRCKHYEDGSVALCEDCFLTQENVYKDCEICGDIFMTIYTSQTFCDDCRKRIKKGEELLNNEFFIFRIMKIILTIIKKITGKNKVEQ
jgi:hypothetical protein